ncbi:MAG: hypothetical protein ACRESJ_12130 [Pseudomonas sp.]|uniref:hypothetical protein n=1 Tax=Pseudomonas sp. TaxID=306 RepID=UPI003D6E7176
MSYASLPASRPAYSYDPQTRELLGMITVFLSPDDGSYQLPPSVVEFSPGEEAGLYRRHRLTKALDAWEPVPDYRYFMLYVKATALPTANTLALGDALPDDLTTSQPVAFGSNEPLRNQWDGVVGTWRVIPDYSDVPLWEKATALRTQPLSVGEPLPCELTPLCPPFGPLSQWDSDKQAWAGTPIEVAADIESPPPSEA